VFWVVLLQKEKGGTGCIRKTKAKGQQSETTQRGAEATSEGKLKGQFYSCTAFTLAIWRCSPKTDVKKKSQEVVMRSSSEGRQMKGTFAWNWGLLLRLLVPTSTPMLMALSPQPASL